MTYRERRQRRAERLREWAEKRRGRATAGFQAAHQAVAGIPPGQPILVGHHSERHHRRALERHDGAMRRAFESQTLAASMASRAAEIDRQAEHAIYRDDPDAIARLAERIAGLEAERVRKKAINAAIRKGEGWEARLDPALTEGERRALLHHARFSPGQNGKIEYPAYVFQNLGGNINRQKKRLAQLRREAEKGAPDAEQA
jgi:hypothetical protein